MRKKLVPFVQEYKQLQYEEELSHRGGKDLLEDKYKGLQKEVLSQTKIDSVNHHDDFQ